jgi:CRP-like cAMP-binding protein
MQTAPNQLVQFFRNSGFFSELQLQQILGQFEEKTLQRQEWLLKEHTVCNEYFFLAEGFMRAYVQDTEGNDVTTNFFPAGQVVCEVASFFKRIPSRENIQALQDCKGYYLRFDQLNALFHAMPEFREFGRSVLVNALSSLKSRTLSMITETAETRYTQLLQNHPEIFQQAPLKYIASYLGITDSSLSRIRKEFSKK